MSGIPRVVLAGGRASPELAAQIHSSVRAMALFQGKPLIDLVVDALLAADATASVTVVGDIPESAAFVRVPDQGDFVSNIIAGVTHYANSEWLLITSADMPFLSGAIISQFVQDAHAAATAANAEIVYPIVPVARCYAKFPGIKRTAVKLREGEFTGGNLMLARPSFFLDRRDLLGKAYAARKKPFQLAWMLGVGTLARLAVSQLISPQALNIAALEQQVGRLVQGRVTALISQYPELATDLDRPTDFANAERFVAAGRTTGS